MKAKLKAGIKPDGMNLEAGKWYKVIEVECYREKRKYGEVKKVLIKNEKEKDPRWYKAKYFKLAAEAYASISLPTTNEAAAGAAMPAMAAGEGITAKQGLEIGKEIAAGIQAGMTTDSDARKELEKQIERKMGALMYGA